MVWFREKYGVRRLTPEQRNRLQSIWFVLGSRVSSGDHPGPDSCLRRTRDGAPHSGKPKALDVAEGTVFRTKRRFAETGLAGVLNDHIPNAHRYRKLDDRGEAHLIALA